MGLFGDKSRIFFPFFFHTRYIVGSEEIYLSFSP